MRPDVEGVEPMGRGRAKAKQTKVARQLKYNSGRTDLSQLARELGAASQSANGDQFEDADRFDEPDDELEDDPYAQYASKYNVEDEDDEDGPPSGPSARRRR
ncbi:DUF3073 domain-containing protein [Streptomyces sp. YIM 98790]|uniref:DUF3073 domain-containing protein n=1 Tax=Streptomyces sp. YIM 98790 TaxID=2689077 RepID=UPI0028BDC73C|nr:DUF3073 domain-containing protein [Streptomyces sp. YIM 98790]